MLPHLKFPQHGQPLSNIGSGKKPVDLSGKTMSSRSSGVCNDQNQNFRREHSVEGGLSLEKATDNVMSITSTASQTSKEKESSISKTVKSKSLELHSTPPSISQSSSHSRYCCDNIPVA